MPELPEVESARRQIDKYCLNKKLEKVDLIERGGHARDGEFDDIVIDESLKDGKELLGRSLVSTARKGKHIIWELSGKGRHLVFHFGMTGNFRIKGVKDFVHYKSSKVKYDDDAPAKDIGNEVSKKKGKNAPKDTSDETEVGGEGEEEILVAEGGKWPPRFTKAMFYFSDGIIVAFTDPRRLGRLRARAKPFEEEPIKELAADPIHDLPSEEDFISLVKSAGTREIKTVLLDQTKIVSGIGNYLADECLHQAEIHPCQRTNSLSKEQILKLRDTIYDVCKTACDCLEKKLDFPSSWLFHGRWASKKDKDAHKKHHIAEIKVGGRTTLYDISKQVLKKEKGSKAEDSDDDGDANIKPKKTKKSVGSAKPKRRKVSSDDEDE